MRGEESGESVATQVLQQNPAARRVLAVNGGYVHAARREQVPYLEEGPAGWRRSFLGHLLGLRPVGDEHGDRGATGQGDPKVPARRGSSGHRLAVERRGVVGKNARDKGGERPEVEGVDG